VYGSTCFGRPHAHHQEFNNCSSSLWFCRWSVVVAVLLVVVGPAGRPAEVPNSVVYYVYCLSDFLRMQLQWLIIAVKPTAKYGKGILQNLPLDNLSFSNFGICYSFAFVLQCV
jgi:hypothetical protein